LNINFKLEREEKYRVKFNNDEILVPLLESIKHLTLLFLRDWGALVKFYHEGLVVTRSFSHKSFPSLDAIGDKHEYEEFQADKFRCKRCRAFVKANFNCTHLSYCRRELTNSALSIVSSTMAISPRNNFQDNDEEHEFQVPATNKEEENKNDPHQVENFDDEILVDVDKVSDEEKIISSKMHPDQTQSSIKYKYAEYSIELGLFYKSNFPSMSSTAIRVYADKQNYVAFDGLDIVGAITFVEKEMAGVRFCYVSLLAVHEDHRRKGIASHLWNHALKITGKLLLWEDENENSKKFYKKMGTKKCFKLGFSLQMDIKFTTGAKFAYVGLTKEDIAALQSYGTDKIKKQKSKEKIITRNKSEDEN
jgi:ribosomal protein S18 acetylase RimI-like enzyme